MTKEAVPEVFRNAQADALPTYGLLTMQPLCASKPTGTYVTTKSIPSSRLETVLFFVEVTVYCSGKLDRSEYLSEPGGRSVIVSVVSVPSNGTFTVEPVPVAGVIVAWMLPMLVVADVVVSFVS